MRKAIIAWMFFAALMTSCSIHWVGQGPWVKKVDSYEASRLMLNFAAKMKREHRLELEDSRMIYNDDIKKFYIEFSSQQLLTLVEARLLIVEVVEEFLYRLNNNTILGFELNHFPFTAKDLEIKINFESYFGLYVDPLYIGSVWLKCGCVYFYAFDRKDNDIDWDHHRWEPYFKSRELALLKKEADLPEIDIHSPAVPGQSTLIYERYLPPGP